MALSENNGTGGNVGNWHVRGHSKITAQDNGSATIQTTSSIESFGGWHYSGLNIHAGACVNGQWAGVDKTGVNVGTNSTVQLVSKTLKVSKTRNWQSIDCIADVRVNGFAAGFSQVHVAVGVPPKPSHTVSYNANGGSGAPRSATKWYGENFYISNQKPTRANHVFQYWATASNGSGTRYNPGQRYMPDANATLYAVWKLATKPPTIQSFTAQRVDEAGDMSESGTRVKLYVTWKCDTSGDSANTVQSVTIAVQDGGTWQETPVTANSATGTGTVTLTGLSADSSWRFRATVRDKYGTVNTYTTVGPQRFLLDFNAGGRGIGIGVGAPTEGVAINGTPVTINGCVMPRMFKGSKVVNPTEESNKHDLFTNEEFAELTGSSDHIPSAVILVSNGDAEAYENLPNWVGVVGSAYVKSTAKWVVFLDRRISHPFRVNYTIIV